MLIYGDPQFQTTVGELFRILKGQFQTNHLDRLDSLRNLLIVAGQFEQAISDINPNHKTLGKVTKITDFAAQAFCHAYKNETSQAITSIRYLEDHLAHFVISENQKLTIKIPEGYAFYTLYPEQYYESAIRWAVDHQDHIKESVLVIGIRSIGTSLSAIVNAALRGRGWVSRRLTVRPVGDPFARRVDLPGISSGPTRFGIVVDEGPGISGSSMAAVAEALHAAAIPDNHIAFFPGHANPPGSAASKRVQSWWQKVPRYSTPLEHISWDGLPFEDFLKKKSSDLLRERVTRLEDWSGGQWRQISFARLEDWPAVIPIFERTKYRAVADSGAAVIWKFAGLGVATGGDKNMIDAAAERTGFFAAQGFTSGAMDVVHGWLVSRRQPGKNLNHSDANQPGVIGRISEYLLATCGPPLSEEEQHAAIARLANVLFHNTKEAFGIEAAKRISFSPDAVAHRVRQSPAYSDGRMAPHKWLLTDTGNILKCDVLSHEIDHTIIGKQSLLWDIAGVIVEWKMANETSACLIDFFETKRIKIDSSALEFFVMAYAAFRMGQTHFGVQSLACDKHKHARLKKAFEYYRQQLAKRL